MEASARATLIAAFFLLHFLDSAVDAQRLAIALKPNCLCPRATKQPPDYQSSSALPGKCTHRNLDFKVSDSERLLTEVQGRPAMHSRATQRQKVQRKTVDRSLWSCSAQMKLTGHNNQAQRFSAKLSVNYANCILVQDQLHPALLELESARTIISLIREDFKKMNNSEASKLLMQSLPCESSGHEQASDQWIPVVPCSNKNKKMPMVTPMKTDQSFISSNRFSPLNKLQRQPS